MVEGGRALPVVSISATKLTQLVGKSVNRDRLVTLLGEIGCDVKGYERVAIHSCPKCGETLETTSKEGLPRACPLCGADFSDRTLRPVSIGESEVVRMELLPVRPDLFDVGGLARALRGYLGYEIGIPIYQVSSSGYSVSVDKKLSSKSSFRPYIGCAVVRNLNLDSELVRILMKLQENLHWALGRDRRKASIGVYDLAKLKPDFSYRTVKKDGVRFLPLGGLPGSPSREATPEEILSKHPKGMAYKWLLEGFRSYPLLADSDDRVLSIPPIINSDNTKVSEETRELFIDVTGPDKRSVEKTLHVLVCSLAELGGKIESVTIDYPEGREVTPDLSIKTAKLSPANACQLIGVEISSEQMVELLRKMRYEASLGDGGLKVGVPAYRTDIMHEVDLIEDVAIAYGYHNIQPSVVPTLTIGEQAEIERFSSIIRSAMTGMGFCETMSLMLTNPKTHYSMLNMEEARDHVRVENPASAEQSIVRTHLFSGLLETFRLSRTQKMPQRIFELGDVSVLDERTDTGARDVRKVAGGIMDPKTGFAEIKSAVEALVRELGLTVAFGQEDDSMFITGRCAVVNGGRGDAKMRRLGVMGEVHPQVLENFEIVQPVSIFELDLSTVMAMQKAP